MALRVAMEWLGSCSGCEISFLNMGEELITLLSKEVEFVHAPLLMDHKYHGQCGEKKSLALPEADIGLVSGGVNTDDHLEILLEMRKKCNYIVALGTCATHGGIPALMNGTDQQQSWLEIFQNNTTDQSIDVPHVEVPAPLERVYACDEKVNIDLLLPGCPPHPMLISEVLHARLQQREADIPGRSVCDTCPVVRDGKGDVTEVKRFTQNAKYDPNLPIAQMRCLLEQGYMCMGPVTRAGCTTKGLPRCIHARVPCRGCYGPVRQGSNQMLDMMNALVSNGIDFKTVVDRRSLLRFSGAHGRLRPLRKK